jgi:O-methyltransferase
MWLRNWFVQKTLSGGRLERLGLRLWSRLQFCGLSSRKEKKTVDLLWKIHKEGRSLLSAFEGFIVYSLAWAQTQRDGAFAEVGVFQGASAKLICETKGDKTLHLFDTFEGLPPASEHDAGILPAGRYKCSLESVQQYLKGYSNVHYHKGVFPESTSSVEEAKYAFAHLDVDLYQSTADALAYFYPRMVPGGVILSHDYDLGVGVRKAFHEFFAGKPEGIVELPTTQCLVTKL